MKRELLENVKVKPYTSGDAIDREGYLSAVLGVSLGAATGTPNGITVKVTFTECDTELHPCRRQACRARQDH